jgi:hypothetical protein
VVKKSNWYNPFIPLPVSPHFLDWINIQTHMLRVWMMRRSHYNCATVNFIFASTSPRRNHSTNRTDSLRSIYLTSWFNWDKNSNVQSRSSSQKKCTPFQRHAGTTIEHWQIQTRYTVIHKRVIIVAAVKMTACTPKREEQVCWHQSNKSFSRHAIWLRWAMDNILVSGGTVGWMGKHQKILLQIVSS